jgi:hypothetical protein
MIIMIPLPPKPRPPKPITTPPILNKDLDIGTL